MYLLRFGDIIRQYHMAFEWFQVQRSASTSVNLTIMFLLDINFMQYNYNQI